MATSGKVNAKVAKRIAHWKAFGLGRDAIAAKVAAEGHPITGRTVSRVLANLSPASPPPKATRPRRGTAAERGAAVADSAASALDTTGDERGDVLEALRARHTEVRGIADELAPLSKQGGRNAAVYCQLVRLEGDLAARVRELTPPPPPDPMTDPGNVQAKALLIATIEGLVAQPVEES